MTNRNSWRLAVLAALATILALPEARAQQAPVLKKEFSFGYVGAVPLSNLLILGPQIYGVTYASAASYQPLNDVPPPDNGGIFSYATSGPGTPTVLYSFSGPDGSHPTGALIADAQGNLYGTTAAGGALGFGTIFKFTPSSGMLTTLHSFTGTDGADPETGVTLAPDGFLYGTTNAGGGRHISSGTVFKLSTNGSGFKVIAELADDGAFGSRTNVAVDQQGNVIGTTYGTFAARAAGSLFKVTPNGPIADVTGFGSSEGPYGLSTGQPVGNLVRDGAGDIFGMFTNIAYNDSIGSRASQGAAVFEVTAVTHKLLIKAFFPNLAAVSGVVLDKAGNLYGTTVNGGQSNTGTVFKLSPSGTVTTVASIPLTGLAPVGGVVPDTTGKLWGTTSAGGNVGCTSGSNVTPTGCGTLFSITP